MVTNLYKTTVPGYVGYVCRSETSGVLLLLFLLLLLLLMAVSIDVPKHTISDTGAVSVKISFVGIFAKAVFCQ